MGPRVLMLMGYPAGARSSCMTPLPRTHGTSSVIFATGECVYNKGQDVECLVIPAAASVCRS